MPRRAVERFLATQDVVYELCQHFSLLPRPIATFGASAVDLPQEDDYDPKAYVAQRTALASMARTCKALSVPATATLWAVLHGGLRPLLTAFSGLERGAHHVYGRYYTYSKRYYVSVHT